ncbi:MAG: hypothetical protein Alpg2KO_00520 [Alphaproteobacteria bacterium]
MIDPVELIQKRTFARLNVEEFGYPIYGDPPKDAPLPYAAIDVSVKGRDGVLEVHVWSEYRGEKEALEILNAAFPLLHRRRLVSEQGVTAMAIHQETEVQIEENGSVRHGRAIYKLLVRQRR